MKILFGIIVCLLPFFSFAHEEESSVLISITNKGFEPSTLSIEPHTKVVFINRDAEGHWPASDRHPTHSDYSGTDLDTHCSDEYKGPAAFDSCRALAEGEAWSFIFEEPGIFHYHDHAWSHLGGTITVKEARIKLRIEVWIESLKSWLRSVFIFDIDKFEAELVVLVNSTDPKVAIDALREKSSSRSSVSEVCHDLVHEIGRTAFKKYQSIEKATSFQNDFCNSGYIHGVFEEYFLNNEIEVNTLSSLCSNNTRVFDAWQCNHGIGHGLMYKNGGDILKTLEECQTGLDKESASQCYNGAYMELFNNEVLLHEPSFLNKDNLLESCSSMKISSSDCYLYLPTYFTQNLKWSYEETFEACMILEKPTRLSCINGTAAEAAKRNQHNLKEIFSLCARFESGEELNACIKGASTITVFQTASIESAFSACNKAGEYIERCRFFVKEFQPLFVPTY